MSAYFLITAALLTAVIPIFVGAGAFFVLLPWWAHLVLHSRRGTQARLQFVVSEDYVGWAPRDNRSGFRNSPYPIVLYAALVALATTLIEAIAFASGSEVPIFWWSSGIIASAPVLVGAFAVAWLLEPALRRLIDRTFQQQANGEFASVTETIVELREIARQTAYAYASMDLEPRIDVVELGRQVVLGQASLGPAYTTVALDRIKAKAEHDLRWIQYLAPLFADIQIKLKHAEAAGVAETQRETIDAIENLIRSRRLAEALTGARWSEAFKSLKQANDAIERLPNSTPHVSTVPASLDDARRVLNVGAETPLERIKAIVTAYRRVWHPDLARDEVEMQQFKSRMQQINAAWDIIQRGEE